MGTYDPRPIPEHSPPFNGHNAQEIVTWAQRTLEHYEQPSRYVGSTSTPDSMTLRNPYLEPAHDTVTVSAGQSFTFSERSNTIVPREPSTGPEILARDHAPTVAEQLHLYQEQSLRGITATPGKDFTSRRAADLAAQAGSVARHPSGKYAATHAPPGGTVHRLPPRIGG